MKKAAALLCIFLLSGCSFSKSEMDRAMGLRSRILDGQSCTFDANITADYGDKLYSFSITAAGDSDGNLSFSVSEPQSISGITGTIASAQGYLTFDSAALAVPLLADDQITPISAPWIFLKTLRAGYLTSAETEGELLHLRMEDSFSDDPLHLDIWLDASDSPIKCEMIYRERKILSLEVNNFRIQ